MPALSMVASFLGLTLCALGVAAVPLVERAAPTVTLDGATFTGVTSGTHTKFLGIPFAQPPCVLPVVRPRSSSEFNLVLATYVTVYPRQLHIPTAPSTRLLMDLHAVNKLSIFHLPLSMGWLPMLLTM